MKKKMKSAVDLAASTRKINRLWGTVEASWRKTVQTYVLIGRELNRVRKFEDDGKYGKWGPWLETLSFSPRLALHFMTIAKNDVIANPKFATCLPDSWTTLSALAQLPQVELKEAIVKKRVTPETTREDVSTLWPEKGKQADKGKKPSLTTKQERANLVLKSYRTAASRLVKVAVGDIDVKRLPNWVDKLLEDNKGVAAFCDKLKVATKQFAPAVRPAPLALKNLALKPVARAATV